MTAEDLLADFIDSTLGGAYPILRACTSDFAEQLARAVERLKPFIIVAYSGRTGASYYTGDGEIQDIWVTGTFAISVTNPSPLLASLGDVYAIAHEIVVAIDGEALVTPFTPRPLLVKSTSYTYDDASTSAAAVSARIVVQAEFSLSAATGPEA